MRRKTPNTYTCAKHFMIFTLVLLGIMLPVPTRAGNHNIASWYGGGEKLNECTANGEIFNPTELTCASWDYPFGTMLKVTNTTSGRSVIVRVNDRGPNRRLGRAIDLTKAAFAEIAKLGEGLIFVEIEKI